VKDAHSKRFCALRYRQLSRGDLHFLAGRVLDQTKYLAHRSPDKTGLKQKQLKFVSSSVADVNGLEGRASTIKQGLWKRGGSGNGGGGGGKVLERGKGSEVSKQNARSGPRYAEV